MTTALTVFAIWVIGIILALIYFLKVFAWEREELAERDEKTRGVAGVPLSSAVIASMLWPIVLILIIVVLVDKYLLKGKIARRLDSWW